MSDGKVKCQFSEMENTTCPVPRTCRMSWEDCSGRRDVDTRFDIPKHGIRFNWPEGAVGLEVPPEPICKRCEHTQGIKKVLKKDTGDFCLDCIHFARDWSPSWCWFVGEPGHRLPNGQCDQYVDNGQFTGRKVACPLHDQWQYDSNGNAVLNNCQFVLKEFKTDDKGEFVLEGGSKVQIEKLWPDTLGNLEKSGAWYAGRDHFSGSLDYPNDYEWPDYSR